MLLPFASSTGRLAAGALLARETTAPTPTSYSADYFISTKYVTVTGVTNDHVTVPGKTITIAVPTCIQTIEPDSHGYLPAGTCGAIWKYYPNFSVALVFAVLFGLLTALHVWQAVRYKKRFCWVIVMASLWETCAFTFRAISSRYQQNVGIYLIFQVFILLAPLWVNAFDYMLLGRLIHYFLPTHSLLSIPAPTIAAVFVGLDFISFVVQLVGGSMAGPASSAEDQLKATHIYMGGIGLQEFFILVFVGLAVKFQLEMMNVERYRPDYAKEGKGWRSLLSIMYGSLGLITVRIIFRFVEFSRGHDQDNPLITSEAYFYALEALPMFLAIMAFNIIHPGQVLVGPASDMPGLFATLKGLRHRGRGEEMPQDSDEEGFIGQKDNNRTTRISLRSQSYRV